MSVAAAARQKLSIETLVPADATRDKRSMLNAQVAALEGWYLPQSLDIWRQTPCKDCFGRQPGHAGGSSIIEAHAVWSSLTPNSRTKSARQDQRKQPDASGTPQLRLTASRARGGDGACKTAALGDALLGSATIGNIHDRVFVLSTVAHSIHWSSRRGACPRFGQLRPSTPSPPGKQLRILLYISTTPIHPLIGRRSNRS